MANDIKHIIAQGYIPVGTVFSEQEMATLPKSFLRERDIFDPAYAGFEKNFQWQKYIHLDIDDQIMRMRVMGTLSQFAHTPKGQHLIRQAAAMQTFQPESGIDGATKLDIVGGERNTYAAFKGMKPILTLGRNEIEVMEFEGLRGNYYDISVQNVVFHELLHAADAMMDGRNSQSFRATHGRESLEALKEYLQESRRLARESQTLHSPLVFGKSTVSIQQAVKPEPPALKTLHSPSLWERATGTVKGWGSAIKGWFSSSENDAPKDDVLAAPKPMVPKVALAKTADQKEPFYDNLSPKDKASIDRLRERAAFLRHRDHEPVMELTAIRLTNDFMLPYYNEPARVMNHSAARKEPENERYETYKGLGGDHMFDAIRLPKLPFEPLKPERGSR